MSPLCVYESKGRTGESEGWGAKVCLAATVRALV